MSGKKLSISFHSFKIIIAISEKQPLFTIFVFFLVCVYGWFPHKILGKPYSIFSKHGVKNVLSVRIMAAPLVDIQLFNRATLYENCFLLGSFACRSPVSEPCIRDLEDWIKNKAVKINAAIVNIPRLTRPPYRKKAIGPGTTIIVKPNIVSRWAGLQASNLPHK